MFKDIPQRPLRLGIISSAGGHLFQIIQLKKLLKNYSHFWVTKKGADSDYFLKKEKKYYGFFPESRNLANAVKNFFLALKILAKEKPQFLLSAGAGIAVPFFLAGKLFFKAKLIYIEPFDFVKHPTLTGKILHWFADLFLVQQKAQKKWYPKAKYYGSLI